MKYQIGIDWADQHHDICILDNEGKKVEKFQIKHNHEGFETLLDRVQSLQSKHDEIGFSIETNQGILVNFLLDQGYSVYPIHPKSVERLRDRYSPSSKKDDGFDAYVLADVLRTDRERLRKLEPDSDMARELKGLVFDREHLIDNKTRVANHLTSCLKFYYPVALKMFSDVQSNITLQFLKAYPKPQDLEKMRLKEFKNLLDKHQYPWKMVQKTPKDFYREIQQMKPFLTADPVTVKTKSRLMLVLLQQLLALNDQIKEYDKDISRLMKNYPDNDIFSSLPGAGKTLAPQLASHFGENRQRFENCESIQTLSGTAPVTRQSGKTCYVGIRRACQKRFRQTMTQYAFSSLRQSLWARKYYDQKRKQGCKHYTALRSLANRWVKIIYAMWKNRTSYQEEVFLASKQRNAMMNAS